MPNSAAQPNPPQTPEDVLNKLQPGSPVNDLKNKIIPESPSQTLKDKIDPRRPFDPTAGTGFANQANTPRSLDGIKQNARPLNPLDQAKNKISPDNPLDRLKDKVRPQSPLAVPAPRIASQSKPPQSPEDVLNNLQNKVIPKSPSERLKDKIDPRRPFNPTTATKLAGNQPQMPNGDLAPQPRQNSGGIRPNPPVTPETGNSFIPKIPISANNSNRANDQEGNPEPAENKRNFNPLPLAGLGLLPLFGALRRKSSEDDSDPEKKARDRKKQKEEEKEKKKRRRRIVFMAGIAFLILSILFSTVASAGVYAMMLSRVKETVNPTNFLSTLHCETWGDAPSGYQASIENAADTVGIHPALLGAIFMSEHGDSLKASPGSDGIWAQGGNAEGPFQIENFQAKWKNSVYKKFSDNVTGDPNSMEDSALLAAAFIRATLEDNGLKSDGIDEVTVKATGMLYNRGPENLQKWRKMGFPLNNPPENPTNPDWRWGANDYVLRTWRNFQGLNNGCLSLTSITTALLPGSLIGKVNLNLGYKKASKCDWVELPDLEQYYHKYPVGGTLNQWGQQSLINIVVAVSKVWTGSGRPKPYVGDISKECAIAHGSVSHADGLGADIQLPGHMMNLHENSGAINKNYDAADKQLNTELAKAFIESGIKLIYYDDPDVIAAVNTYAARNGIPAKMVAWPGHYAHMHVSIGSY